MNQNIKVPEMLDPAAIVPEFEIVKDQMNFGQSKGWQTYADDLVQKLWPKPEGTHITIDQLAALVPTVPPEKVDYVVNYACLRLQQEKQQVWKWKRGRPSGSYGPRVLRRLTLEQIAELSSKHRESAKIKSEKATAIAMLASEDPNFPNLSQAAQDDVHLGLAYGSLEARLYNTASQATLRRAVQNQALGPGPMSEALRLIFPETRS
jgi:hypothetical protein